MSFNSKNLAINGVGSLNFFGGNTITVDSKGRISVPVSLREKLNKFCDGELVVTESPHKDPHLVMYPLPNWHITVASIIKLPTSDTSRRLKRNFIGTSVEVKIDKNGRILLPQVFRQKYNLNKEIHMAGVGRFFEIWEKSSWINRDSDAKDQDETVMEEVDFG